MSADQENVTADQPTTLPRTRDEARRAWEAFLPRVPAYDAERNGMRPGHRAVSRLSPAIRQRLVTEYELIASTLAAHLFARVEKFVQEILWRRYWKSWLELRPSVWTDYRADAARQRGELRGYQAKRITELEAGRSGVEIMDHFARDAPGGWPPVGAVAGVAPAAGTGGNSPAPRLAAGRCADLAPR